MTTKMNVNMNSMRRIEIDKVVINIGVGESGGRLANAEKILSTISGQKPLRATSKKTIQPFNIKKGEPIGCKVTLRRTKAENFLKRCFKIQKKLLFSQFSENGDFSFGIPAHIDLGIPYNPKVGIFGMDVSISLKRAGYRIKERKIEKKKIPKKQRINKEESINFIEKTYGVEVIEEE